MNLLRLSEERPRPNLKDLQYQIWTPIKRPKKQLSCKANFNTFFANLILQYLIHSNFRLILILRL